MGIGDEIMMAGEARRRAAGTQRKFQMLDRLGRPKWHWVWEGNPNIARPGEPHDGTIGYTNGLRPYLVQIEPKQYTFRAYKPYPAQLVIPEKAMAMAKRTAGAIVFNPTIKQGASPNKQWGLGNWRRLHAVAAKHRWVQIGEPGMPQCFGAQQLVTRDFWEACAAMKGARAVVCHEGALHHAAAALGVPTIVIYGGFISPKVTGYDGQVAFFWHTPLMPLGCGRRWNCPHCKEAMGKITPEAVSKALDELLSKR